MYTSKLFTPYPKRVFIKFLKKRHYHVSQVQRAKMKMVAQLSPQVEAKLAAEEYKPNKHPGIRKAKCIGLPEKLIEAAYEVLNEQDMTFLMDSKKKFDNYLYSRRLPIEADELNERTINAMKKMNLLDKSVEDADIGIKKKFKKLKNKLNCEVERWKPLDFTENHACLTYMLSRLAANYAATYQVFSEIRHMVPSFQPKTFFDFGSGLGSAVWAANALWEKSIKEYFCVDTSAQMNHLSQLLLQGGKEDVPMFVDNIYFRQFLPASVERTYDLVVSSFTLMELPSFNDRIRTIDTLWQKTSDTLVVIESGSNAGFSAVLEARDYVLRFEEEFNKNSNGVHVLAPCPHKMSCPKFGVSTIPCHFPIMYHPFIPKKNSAAVKKDLYSYVIIKRGDKDKSIEEWPRIVHPVIKRSKMAHCKLCCNDGKLHEIIFSKGKYPQHTFKCARKSSHGDLLPVSLSQKEVGQIEDNIVSHNNELEDEQSEQESDDE